jgi:predicted AAA+ superfamily ATPase
MVWGGMPQVALNKDLSFDLLNSYYNTIIIKDIVRRYKIRDEEKMRTLAKYYVYSTASRITFNSVSKFLKIPVMTVERYSKYLENSYLIYFLRNFSFSVKAVENSPRKVHVIDNGFIRLFNPKLSRGHLLESVVSQHLYRYSLSRGFEIYYWYQDNYEVDFVLKGNGKILPIQVAYDVSEEETLKREIRALERFKEKASVEKSLLITYHVSENVKGDVEVVPAYMFLIKYEKLLDEMMGVENRNN